MTGPAGTPRDAWRESRPLRPLDVLVLYNRPVLGTEHPDRASEAGVLETVEAVSAALGDRGHRVRALGVEADLRPLAALLFGQRPDLVFNLCEGLTGTGAGESQVAGLVELAGLPFTGAPSDCLALVRDKPRTKWLLRGAGLPTPRFRLVEPSETVPLSELRSLLESGPVIVKPAREDASLGIGPQSVVTVLDALGEQVRRVRAAYGAVLVEEFLEGREFNAAVVGLPEPRLLPLSEIDYAPQAAGSWPLVTYDAKWSPHSADFRGTPVRCPAEVPGDLADEIAGAALAAWRLAGCRQYARIDLRLDAVGRPNILEINANPDLSPSAGLACAWQATGKTYAELVCTLAEQALQAAISQLQ